MSKKKPAKNYSPLANTETLLTKDSKNVIKEAINTGIVIITLAIIDVIVVIVVLSVWYGLECLLKYYGIYDKWYAQIFMGLSKIIVLAIFCVYFVIDLAKQVYKQIIHFRSFRNSNGNHGKP